MLCDLVKVLSENACIDVIRLIYHELGYNELNQLLIDIIMKLVNNKTTTNEHFIQIENIIRQVITKTNINDQNNNNKIYCKTTKEESKLIRLPIEIINKTATFLDEKDIFSFEQCCKLFYQIINNSCYLKQSNNFKTFEINTKRLHQMINPHCSFYKYLFCQTLRIRVENDIDDRTIDWHQQKRNFAQSVIKFETRWNELQCGGSWNGHEYMKSIFKSIRLLECIGRGELFLHSLPIDVLFDPHKSKLETVKLNHWDDAEKDYNEYLNKFRKKYLDFKESMTIQGENIKVLDFLSHRGCEDAPDGAVIPHQFDCVESKHIHLWNTVIDLPDWDWNHNSSLTTISCEWSFFWKYEKMKNDYSGRIETLRLINTTLNRFETTDDDKVKAQKLAESLNLHNSVKRLTTCETIGGTDEWEDFEPRMLSILSKKRYLNLENVNILFEMEFGGEEFDECLDLIFAFFEQHAKILQYQFKELNIGFEYHEKYQIIEWDCNVDDKKLDQERQKWYQLDHLPLENQKNKEKYYKLMYQWSHPDE